VVLPLKTLFLAVITIAYTGRRIVGLFFKSLRRTDALRRYAWADLFRRRLRLAAKMVAVGTDRICREYSDLGFGGTRLVEDSGMVVSGVRHSSTARVRGDSYSARLALPGAVPCRKPQVRRRLVL
jgi:hypothetical protein